MYACIIITYIESTYFDSIGVVKHLRIHSQFFQILKIEGTKLEI